MGVRAAEGEAGRAARVRAVPPRPSRGGGSRQ